MILLFIVAMVYIVKAQDSAYVEVKPVVGERQVDTLLWRLDELRVNYNCVDVPDLIDTTMAVMESAIRSVKTGIGVLLVVVVVLSILLVVVDRLWRKYQTEKEKGFNYVCAYCKEPFAHSKDRYNLFCYTIAGSNFWVTDKDDNYIEFSFSEAQKARWKYLELMEVIKVDLVKVADTTKEGE